MSPRRSAILGIVLALVSVDAYADEVHTQADAGPSAPTTTHANRIGVEAGYGTTTSTGSPPARFLYQRATAAHQLTPSVELSLGARITEDLEAPRSPDPSTQWKTGSDVVTTLSGRLGVDLSPRWSLTLGGLASPESSRDIASRVDTSSASSYDLVRARSSSYGATAEIAYDTFDDDAQHDVDLEVVLGVSGTQFQSLQKVVSGATPTGTQQASLAQGAAMLSTTFTFAQDTDVGAEGAFYVYDASDPASVGSFDVTARGGGTSFGVGMPMLPMRWSVRPEIAQRFGRFSLRAGYQLASLALDDSGLSHGVSARAQLALGDAKLYVAGGARRDSLDSSTTSDTWLASVGASFRF